MSDKNILNEEKILDAGIVYSNQKKYELAIDEFQKVLRINPRNDAARVRLGHVYLQRKNFPEALIQFKAAMELKPQNMDSHEGLGFCYFELGRIDEAMAEFNHVLKSGRKTEHTYFGLGLCYLRKDEFDYAIDHFEHVAEINPRHSQVNYHLGLCYHQKKDYPQALIQFNKALEIDPEYWRAHESLAFVYLEQDKLELSLRELQKIDGPYSQSETYHNLMARIYLKQKKDDSATEELQKTLEINPHSEFACEALIRIYCQQHKYKLAKENIQKLLHIAPAKIYLYQDLGDIYLKEKDYPQALIQFNKALEIDPEYWRAHESLAFVYLEQDKLELSLRELQKIDGPYSQSETYHNLMARIYLKQKKDDSATEELQKTLEINPHSEFACEALIRIYCQQHKYKLAKQLINRLISMDSSKLYLFQELGAVYFEEKNYSEAMLCYEKALAEYSRGKDAEKKNKAFIAQTLRDIGRICLLIKKYDSAVTYFKRVIEIDPSDQKLYSFLSKAHLEMRDYDTAVNILSEKYNYFDAADKIGFRRDDTLDKQGKIRIKILRIPNFYNPEILSSEMNSIMLPPLALASIASYVRSQGIPIDQDDLHIKIHYDNYFSQDQEKKIDERLFFDDHRVMGYISGSADTDMDAIMERVCAKSDLAGYQIILFSLDPCSMNFSHAMFALCFAKFLKKKYDPVIILGGLRYFPELMRKMECAWPDIDYVVCNEGEEVVVELLSSLLNIPIPEEKAKYDVHQRIIYSMEVPKPVKPDFEGLPLEKYLYQGLRTDLYSNEELRDLIREFNSSRTLILPFKFIKGCTNRCIFCASSYGGLIHVVEPLTVAGWLEELQNKYQPTGYLFLNDTLNISKKYLMQLCHEIIKRKLTIRWSDCVRVDRLDRDSIYAMRDAGCIRMVFGMETASRKLLKYIQKDIDLAQLEDLLYHAHQAGIWTGIEIISGLPHENDDDVKETISFLQQNKENIDALYYNAFNIKDTSLLQVHPERYGITNIFELSSYEDGFATFVKYGFDEVGGLRWPEKKKQIIANLNKIIDIFGNTPFPEHEYEHFLFFLYTKFANKKRIRDLFYAVGSEKMKYVKSLPQSRRLWEEEVRLDAKTLSYGGR